MRRDGARTCDRFDFVARCCFRPLFAFPEQACDCTDVSEDLKENFELLADSCMGRAIAGVFHVFGVVLNGVAVGASDMYLYLYVSIGVGLHM